MWVSVDAQQSTERQETFPAFISPGTGHTGQQLLNSPEKSAAIASSFAECQRQRTSMEEENLLQMLNSLLQSVYRTQYIQYIQLVVLVDNIF